MTSDPAWLVPVDEAARDAGDGAYVIKWIEALCRVPKDSIGGRAGDLMRLRPWQQDIIADLRARDPATGRRKFREALIGVPRKNGKSGLFSALAVEALVEGPVGGECYALAATRDQARILFAVAKRMVEIEPELSSIVRVYRDVLEYKKTGSVFRALSAEAGYQEGLNPHCALVDEVHRQPDRDLWDVMSLAMGAREEPQLVGITTAGVRYDTRGRDSFCYQLYDHGKKVASGEVDDPTFYFRWYEPHNSTMDHRSPAVWEEANPGLDDLVSREDMASVVTRTPEREFRAKRLNQWANSKLETWLPPGVWQSRTVNRPIPPGADAVLAFDGSFSGDSTGIVATEIGPVPHQVVAGHWEATVRDGKDWRVPILDVEDAIREACRRWHVTAIVADPYRWSRSLQILAAEGLPVEEFPQSPARLTPATAAFFEAVMNATVSHDGDARLARHMDAAVLKSDTRGSRLTKETGHSQRHIDLAVCAVMGHAVTLKSGHNPWNFVY